MSNEPINDGGPVFPQDMRLVEQYMDEGGYARPRSVTLNVGGLSLRDYFAAAALQGMLAYSYCSSNGNWHENSSETGVAGMAYKYADAMLEARKQ